MSKDKLKPEKEIDIEKLKEYRSLQWNHYASETVKVPASLIESSYNLSRVSVRLRLLVNSVGEMQVMITHYNDSEIKLGKAILYQGKDVEHAKEVYENYIDYLPSKLV